MLACQLTGVARAKPVYPVPGKPGELTRVVRSGRVVKDRAALTALLSTSPDLSDLTVAFATAFPGRQVPIRDYAAAEELTHQWRSGGSTDADIRRYLETFGFRNSHGNLGRWRDLPKARTCESKTEAAL